MILRQIHKCVLTAVLSAPCVAHACWEETGKKHGIDPALLVAVGKTESSLNPRAIGHNTKVASDGKVVVASEDIGVMQINSGNLPALARRGISRDSLFDGCTNIDVGASILAEKFARYGVNWNAVGAYNSSCSKLKAPACMAARSRYAWRVYRNLYPQDGQSSQERIRAGLPRVVPQPAPASAPLIKVSLS